jgi:hypothetical protein
MAGKYPDPSAEQRVALINRVAAHVYGSTESFIPVGTSLAYLLWAIADYDSYVSVHAADIEMRRLLRILDKDPGLLAELAIYGLVRPVEDG